MEVKFHCEWYVPCPLCSKCRNVADHLYERCRKCGYSANRCKHTGKEFELMLKRRNFKLNLSEKIKAALEAMLNDGKTAGDREGDGHSS